MKLVWTLGWSYYLGFWHQWRKSFVEQQDKIFWYKLVNVYVQFHFILLSNVLCCSKCTTKGRTQLKFRFRFRDLAEDNFFPHFVVAPKRKLVIPKGKNKTNKTKAPTIDAITQNDTCPLDQSYTPSIFLFTICPLKSKRKLRKWIILRFTTRAAVIKAFPSKRSTSGFVELNVRGKRDSLQSTLF